MSVSIHQIEKWVGIFVGKPVTWAVFCGWLALGFFAAGIAHGTGWLNRRLSMAKRA